VKTKEKMVLKRNFPVQKEPAKAVMDGDLSGTLKIINGYLYVKPDYAEENEMVIWPYGYSFFIYENIVQVLDEKGQPRFRVGDSVRIGGGGVPPDFAEDKIGIPLPDDLDGPCWLAAGTNTRPYIPAQL
jgi:hypothetical protein